MHMTQDALADQSDEVLLALYAQGDRAAARLLTTRFLGRLLSYTLRMLADRGEAEDIAQETLLRLWRAAPDWRAGEAKVSSWLYTVAGNMARDRLRQRHRRRTEALESIPEPEDAALGALDTMMARERLNALDRALKKLPARQRQAVILRHIEELKNPEIATIMGIGVEAVESLTARGKRTLQALLSAQRETLGYEGASCDA